MPAKSEYHQGTILPPAKSPCREAARPLSAELAAPIRLTGDGCAAACGLDSAMGGKLADPYGNSRLATFTGASYPLNMNAEFACSCGQTHWQISEPKNGFRVKCYCADCQTAPRFLEADVLDEAGGTDILQVAPEQITFTQGAENLSVLRLSPQGLLRWYVSCCNTPVANTLKSPKLAFSGVLLANYQGDIRDLRKPGAVVNTIYAKGPKAPKKDYGLGRAIWTFATRAFGQRMSGNWRNTPFFAGPDMTPIAEPRILTREERNRARP